VVLNGPGIGGEQYRSGPNDLAYAFQAMADVAVGGSTATVPRDVDAAPVAWREAGGGGGAAGTGGTGSGRPIGLLHGLGTTRTAWEPQLVALGAQRRCLAWDMPGYGASAPLPAMTFPALANAAAAWLVVAGAAPAHVAGLSMGGMVALHLALGHPAVMRSLVLIDTSPAFGLDGTITAEAWTAARLAPLRQGATPASMARSSIARLVAPGTPPSVIDAAAASAARIRPDAFEQAVRCLPTHDVRGRLASIRVPALVIVGELDAETPPAYAEHLAGAIPTARLAVVPGTGHLSTLERPDTVNRLIAEFLEEHD
jgi:3-oxoadipate enol-lactonase